MNIGIPIGERNRTEVKDESLLCKGLQPCEPRGGEHHSAQVIIKPDCVLGLATGSTPIGTYEELIRRYEKGDLDFSKVHSINLDEYRGLSPENDQSYRYFMNTHLFDKINIDKKNTYVPDGLEPDKEKACRDYEEIIRVHGGVDLQVLGLGHNGHIGFNEPGSVFEKETHCVTLSETTREANARFSVLWMKSPERKRILWVSAPLCRRRRSL